MTDSKTQAKKERSSESRLYQKRGRYYADFRDYADVFGRKEALRPTGSSNATQDRNEALALVKARLRELNMLRANGLSLSAARDLTTLGGLIEYHLEQKAQRSTITDQWLGVIDGHLSTAEYFLGSETLVRDITTKRLAEYATYLTTIPDRRKKNGAGTATLVPSTQRKHLNSLGQLFTRGIEAGVLPVGHNPMEALMEKPVGDYAEADWFEVPEVALLLHAARLYRPKRIDIAVSCIYEIIGVLVLTGGRRSEVLGLEVFDVDFDRNTITFRRHAHRRLKNPGSARVIRLWPQLREILWVYLTGPNAPKGRLLFPSPKNPDKPIQDLDKVFDELAIRIDRPNGVRSKAFRHSYCAARLQTHEQAVPVSAFTVGRELGHGGPGLVERIYGHLGRFVARKDVVEYRIEEFEEVLADQIEAVERRSEERNAYEPRAANLHNRVPLEVEVAVLLAAEERPSHGPRRIAELLRENGHAVSPSGVRSIWVRHGMTRAEDRLALASTGALSKAVQELSAC